MPRYVDWADVADRYPGVAANVPAERAAKYIDDAEAEVDARLAPVYATPFVPGSSNAPQMVRALSCDLAYYRMIWMTEGAEKLKAYIDERFKALLSGDMTLTTSAGALVPAALPWADKAYRSSFGMDDPVNWSVSREAEERSAWERIDD